MMAEQVRAAGGLALPSGRKLGPQMFLPLTIAEIAARDSLVPPCTREQANNDLSYARLSSKSIDLNSAER